MSVEFRALLGEANMSFAEGNYEQAIVELKNCVQQAPTVPDPYFTLAMVYEKLNDTPKALSFYHIAAALTPKVGTFASERPNAAHSYNVRNLIFGNKLAKWLGKLGTCHSQYRAIVAHYDSNQTICRHLRLEPNCLQR